MRVIDPEGQLVSGILLLALLVLFVPLGLAVFVLSAVLAVLVLGPLGSLLGDGAKPFLGAVAIAYWLGTLVVMFFVFRRAYRWLRRRAPVIGTATEIGFGNPGQPAPDAETNAAWARLPTPASAPAPAEAPMSLAELDARLAPRDAPPPEGR